MNNTQLLAASEHRSAWPRTVQAVAALATVTLLAALPAGVERRAAPSQTDSASAPKLADFRGRSASADTVLLAHWIVDSGDNRQMAFAIIDKQRAELHAFDAAGRLIDATPVLLGAALGDDSVPGIGDRPLALVRPEERTTPAGRFVSEPGVNTSGEDVVWVDYDAAVSMHRVRVVDVKQRRLDRLATPSADDNRISYGCVNVPIAFYDSVVKPVFGAAHGVVYVLPETRSARAVFGAYDVTRRDAAAGSRQTAGNAPARSAKL